MLLLTSLIPLRKGTAPLAKTSLDPQSCKVTRFGKPMGLLTLALPPSTTNLSFNL